MRSPKVGVIAVLTLATAMPVSAGAQSWLDAIAGGAPYRIASRMMTRRVEAYVLEPVPAADHVLVAARRDGRRRGQAVGNARVPVERGSWARITSVDYGPGLIVVEAWPEVWMFSLGERGLTRQLRYVAQGRGISSARTEWDASAQTLVLIEQLALPPGSGDIPPPPRTTRFRWTGVRLVPDSAH